MTRTTTVWGLVQLHFGVQMMARLLGTSAHGSRGRLGGSRADHGATSVEYALMASLIAVVIVAAVTLFGRNVSQLFYVPAGVL